MRRRSNSAESIARPAAVPYWDALPTPYALFGMQKLRTAYTGPHFRIRGNGSPATRDFDFNSLGYLDVASILAWGANGYVLTDTWYDQMANAHDAVAPTLSLQAQIDISHDRATYVTTTDVDVQPVGLTLANAAGYGNGATSLAICAVVRGGNQGLQTIAWAQLGTGNGRFELRQKSTDFFETYIRPVTSGTVAEAISGVSPFLTGWHVVIAEVDIAGDVSRIEVDGVAVTSTAGGVASAAAVNSTNAPQIFNSIDTLQNWFGQVAAIAFYRNQTFSAGDRTAIRAALTALIPPIDTGSISTWGDSLTVYGSELGAALPTRRTFGGSGYAGKDTDYILNQMELSSNAKYRSGYTQVHWEGIHEIAFPDHLFDNIITMTNLQQSAGIVVPNRNIFMSVITNDLPDGSQWPGGADYERVAEINKRYQALYPYNFLDIRKILVNSGDLTNPVDVICKSHDATPYTLRGTLGSGAMASGISAGDTSFVLPGSVGVGPGSVLHIDSEYIMTLSTDGGQNVLTCTRGYAGTTAVSHSASATVESRDPLHLAHGATGGYGVVAAAIAKFIKAKGW